MKRITLLVLSCLFVSIGMAQNVNTITSELENILKQKSDELVDVNIYFKSQMSAEHLTYLNVKSDSKEVRREIVINELKKFSQQQQESVMSVINAETRSNNITDVTSHWIVNSINCKASRDVIYTLASHPDIKYIDYNKEEMMFQGEDQEFEGQNVRGSVSSMSDNITHVQADKVWDLGYTGKGVIVAVIDSGINTEHVDLKDHLWYDEGAQYPGYNFVFPSQAPIDDQGHGTHCSGTVCGDGTSGLATGMAPDATLMPLKVTNRSTGIGVGVDRMIDAVEYAADNGADIVSISIGWWVTSAANRQMFRQAFENTLQAGIVVAAAAGNNRESLATYPAPNNINSPADCPPPYLHSDQTIQGGLTSVISVGAVDENNVIAGISSQGPVTWANTTYGDYPYNPGMGLIRPDIVAPGASVKSLAYDSNTGYAIKGGTSMAAPCVAGVMALMLEKNPELTPADLCRIIETTATKLTQTKSNDYGSGCINALAAVRAIDFDVEAPYLSPYSFNNNVTTGTNQNIELTLINNGKESTSGMTNVTITTDDEYVSIVSGDASCGVMAHNGTASVSFIINVNTLVADNHEFILNVNATNGNDSWNFDMEMKVTNPFFPPNNVSASVSGTTVLLSWSETNNATSYNIYRDGSYIANTEATSYTDESLEYGTLYEYTITSKRGDLETEHSVVTRAQTDDNPEKPSPTNVVATKSNNKINVTWNNGSNSKSANVYRLKDGLEETLVASEVNGATYTDNSWGSLTDGIYQYGVANNYPANEVVYEEGFEEISLSTIPTTTNWYTYANWSGNGRLWSFTPSTPENFGGFDRYLGDNAAFINNTVANANNVSYLVTPQLNLSEYNSNTVKLSFYYITPVWTDYPNDINTLQVKVSATSNTDGWIDLWSSNKTNISEWTKVEIDLSAYANNSFYIAFVNVPGGGYCTGVDEMKISIEGNSESRIEWSDNIYKNVNIFEKDGVWNNSSNWVTNNIPSADDSHVIINANAIIDGTVEVNSLTINEGKTLTLNEGAKLTVNGSFNNTDPDAFVINDGAQVFQSNEDVAATFIMDVINPDSWSSDDTQGWQFITSPVKDAPIADIIPADSQYDIYKYEGHQDLEWRNIKSDDNEFETKFVQGRGYLMSYESETIACLKGNIYNDNTFLWDNLSFDADKDLANFHLVGNPFAFDMDVDKLSFDDNMVNGLAIVTEEGGYQYDDIRSIPVGDGFFVKAKAENASLSYGMRNANGEIAKSLNIIATSKAGKDNVVIKFEGKSEGFDKLNNFNKEIATVFVTDSGKRYGIYNSDADTEEIELGFEAKEIGNYTLSGTTNSDFEKVILVDKFTGEETNLLLEDYTFTATKKDNTNRFVVRLTHSPQSIENDCFIYQSGSDFVFNIKGKVQIIDMMGRIVYEDVINNEGAKVGACDFTAGTYIVRVIDDKDVMTQKVVVY